MRGQALAAAGEGGQAQFQRDAAYWSQRLAAHVTKGGDLLSFGGVNKTHATNVLLGAVHWSAPLLRSAKRSWPFTVGKIRSVGDRYT